RLDDAIEACRRAKGSAARVLSSVLDSLKSGQEDIDDVVSEGLLKENRNLHRFNTIILVIAGVAPLLGLLGTVTGMISTFDVITKFGTGDPKLLSGGISTALVTTELGLIVAIPTLLLGNLLKGWGNSIENEVDRIVLRVVNIHKDVRDARAEEA
ncbi:MAG: MotA/TolQ/ExbB proton channel family protein, partial [Myxococcota bacterium]